MKAAKCMQWLTAIATVLLLCALCWQCIDIYLTGIGPDKLIPLENIFRMEDVAARLKAFALPTIAYIFLIVAATVADKSAHAANPSLRRITPENQLRLLKARCLVIPAAAKSEEHQRLLIRGVSALVIGLCTTSGFVYLCNRRNFTSWDLEMVMGKLMVHVFPWVCIALSAATVSAVLSDRSYERECAILKTAPTDASNKEISEKRSLVPLMRITLYFAAFLFIVLGVMNGGLRDVLVKAINICTECIGLG